MKPSHIEHIGIAVANLERAINFYENVFFDLKCYKIEDVADQKIRTAFFMVGHTKIELLESTDPEGPIGRFIENKGEGIHHIAFAVGNISEQMRRAKKEGIRLDR
jgi:methylmalonyl-CoA/ethylmalonyl-CoA epimerase